MPRPTCTICSADPELRTLIENELRKQKGRKPLVELAKLTGLGKSSISRHSVNCMVRERLTQWRDRRRGTGGRPGRIILKDCSSDGPPKWSYRVYSDESDEMQPVGRGFRFERTDLILELVPEPLKPETAQRAERAAATTAALLATSRNRPEAEDADE